MTRRKPLAAALAAVSVVLGTFVVFLAPARALTNCSVSPADQAVDSEEQHMLQLVNEYRMANGRGPLTMDPAVTRAAAWFSRDMATKDYVAPDHVDSFGRYIPTRLGECDVSFNAWAENIAWGNDSAQETFTQWRNSPPHNANMLLPGVSLAGIARAFDAASTFDWYWALDLTSPGAGTPPTTIPPTTIPPTTIPPTTIPPTSTSTPPIPTTSTSTTFTIPTIPTLPTTSTSTPFTIPTTSSSTTSTVAPTSTTTSSSTTSLPPSSTSTSTPSVTTPPVDGDQCATLAAQRTQANAQITSLEQSISRSLSGAQLQATIARLEQIRAMANAQFDAMRAEAGCEAPTS